MIDRREGYKPRGSDPLHQRKGQPPKGATMGSERPISGGAGFKMPKGKVK